MSYTGYGRADSSCYGPSDYRSPGKRSDGGGDVFVHANAIWEYADSQPVAR